MELLVIRHGESEADILGCHEGRADFELTERGVKQVELLAEWIEKNFKPDHIISSTLKRAAKAAEIIGKKVNVEVELDEELMEFNNGLLAGLSFEEAKEKYPAPKERKLHVSYYEQETIIEFRARAEAVLSRIIDEYGSHKRVAIVTHGGMINMLFRSFMKLPMDLNYFVHNGDTAVHLWKIEDGHRQIVFMNSREHLL